MADVILTKDGKRYSFPADKADAAMAAGFAADAPAPVPQQPPRRGRGSGGGIDAGPPPAGETDAADVVLVKDGKKFKFPASRAAEAEAAGFKPEGPGLFRRMGSAVVNAVTGNDRKTDEAESLPDFSLMPEMRQALISNTIPVAGSLSAPLAVAGESFARNLDTDAPGFGVPAAFRNMKANAKTSLGTTMASAAEQVKVILANNPDVTARQDSKGNTILTSAQDGKEYVVPPGVTAFDAPRVAQSMASAVPAATAGAATVGGRVLGNVASKALAGGVGAGLIEGAQSTGGGDFDPENIPIGAVANAIGPAASAGKAAIVEGLSGGAEQEAKNAALRAAAQARIKAAPGGTPSSFADVVAPLQSVADQIGKLTPKQRWVLKNVPFVGKALDGIDDLVKILKDEGEEGAKKLPKEARDVIDDILRKADDATDTIPDAPTNSGTSTPLPPTSPGRSARTPPTPQPSPVPQEVLENSGTSTPLPATNPGRAGPRTPPAAPPAEPSGTRTAPVPQEPTETATAPIRRLPPATEGLEPTEVLPREVPIDPTAPVRKRNLSDDEAKAVVRTAALELGTLDLATLTSAAKLPSSQAQRVLEQLVTNYKFRAQVAANAPKVEAAAAPTVSLSEAAAPHVPADVAGDADARILRDAAARADNMLAVDPDGRMAGQVAATKQSSRWKEQYASLPAEKRAAFIAGLLDEKPMDGNWPERVRTRLGITKSRWRQLSIGIQQARKAR